MAASFNKVLLMGNLTRNPELRHIAGGSAVCEFGIAVNRRFTVNGQERDETTFVDIVVWGRVGENCHRFLSKGSSIFVEGRLQFDQWEDQQGGKRSRLRVVAENVQFIGARREESGEGYQGQGQGGNSNSYGNSYNSNRGGYNNNNGGNQAGPGGYQRGNANSQYAGPGGYSNQNRNAQNNPPVPEEAFDVNDDIEDDIPF